MSNFAQSVKGVIQRVRSPGLGQITIFQASKATLQHKKCNVREDCGTFHTISSSQLVRFHRTHKVGLTIYGYIHRWPCSFRSDLHFTFKVENASAFKLDAISIQPASDLTTAP